MKEIKLKEKSVKIRRAKVKEVKVLVKDMATKLTEVANFFHNKPMTDEELLESIPTFIIENIEFFEEYILKFTIDFTQKDLDNMEFLDLIKIVKEIIIYNGISEDFLKSFFQNFKQASQVTMIENEFTEEVPKA